MTPVTLNMDGIDISYRLKRLGMTQTQIARDLGVRQGVVSNVIHDRATAHGVASHIAKLLGMEIGELWPDRYCFKPRASIRRKQPPSTPACPNSQEGGNP